MPNKTIIVTVIEDGVTTCRKVEIGDKVSFGEVELTAKDKTDLQRVAAKEATKEVADAGATR